MTNKAYYAKTPAGAIVAYDVATGALLTQAQMDTLSKCPERELKQEFGLSIQPTGNTDPAMVTSGACRTVPYETTFNPDGTVKAVTPLTAHTLLTDQAGNDVTATHEVTDALEGATLLGVVGCYDA